MSDFKAVLDELAASGLEAVTVEQGAARLHCPEEGVVRGDHPAK